MGRTVHYWTSTPVLDCEFQLMQRYLEDSNTKIDLDLEDLKIWGGNERFPEGLVWGFTKVSGDEDAELVMTVLIGLSILIPSLTWVVWDEGKLHKVYLKNGKILERSLDHLFI